MKFNPLNVHISSIQDFKKKNITQGLSRAGGQAFYLYKSFILLHDFFRHNSFLPLAKLLYSKENNKKFQMKMI